jgi:hypothetical protein
MTARGRPPRGGGKMRQECSRRYGFPLDGTGLGLGGPSMASEPSGLSDARQERHLEGLLRWAGRLPEERSRWLAGEAVGAEQRR